MVKIKGEFQDGEWWWDEDKYIGFFETEILEVNRVAVTSINDAFNNSGVKSRFVPLVYGGIKPVINRKARILERLMRKDG